MSGRFAITTRATRRAALAVLVALCGAACGLLTPGRDATAQPTPTPRPDAGQVDRNNPVPGDAPKKRPYSDFVIDTSAAMYGWIEDFKPVASEAENPDEYRAWTAVVMKAKQFTAAELEAHGTRVLTPYDLMKVRMLPDVNNPSKPRGSPYRCQLLRFEGKAVCARRLKPPAFFTENKIDIPEMYEIRFVPLDESPLTPVSIAFLELPEGFQAVKEAPLEKWVDVERWIVAAGYYFKTMSVSGDKQPTANIPVIVGKSVTPLPGPPVPPGPDPTVIDPYVRIYDLILDESKMIRTTPNDANWPEVAAFNRVLMHASRFPAAELEKYARADVKFADLFEPVRLDYKLKNVKLEGRLISLRRSKVNNELRAAGIDHVFEGWLVPANEPRGNPVCVVFTEPLEGVEPNGRVNVWVTFAGYSFKKMLYESAESDPNNPNRNVHKYAPLLIGKRPIERRDPEAPSQLSWSLFTTVVIVGSVLIVAAAGGLILWYRGGDRKAKEAVDAARGGNPFAPAGNPPPA